MRINAALRRLGVPRPLGRVAWCERFLGMIVPEIVPMSLQEDPQKPNKTQ